MAYDEHLATRIRDYLSNITEFEERKMFGGLCFMMMRGHMCAGIVGSRLMLRVGPIRYQDALAQPHVREIDFATPSPAASPS
jgi:TfoX/Sxy family transcriptional regulator of competence genes